MTAQELIKKYGLVEATAPNGQKGFRPTFGIMTKKVKEELVAHKEEIKSLLKEKREKEEAEARIEQEAKEQEKQDIISGKKKIKVVWHDGEYLSGYTVYGQESDLLEELRIGEHVSGWGTHIPEEVIKKLGEEFTYAEAAEFLLPKRKAKEQKEAKVAADRQAKFDEAKATGKPVLLRHYMADCNDPHEECSLDSVSEYAMPDGTVKTERMHTW